MNASALGWVLALAPIAMVTFYVAHLANRGPVGDQWWDVGYIAIKTRAGVLTLEDLLVYALGHRPALIRLHTVLFTWLTGYDVGVLRFTALVNAIANVGLALVLFHTHMRRQRMATDGLDSRLFVIGAPLFALIIFTLYHPDSWLDYYFAVWQQPLFFLLLVGLVLEWRRPGWLGLSIVVLCAVACTFTLALGMVAWISVAAALFAVRGYRRWSFFVAWVASGTVCMAFYASDYAVSPYHVSRALPSVDTLRQLASLHTLAYLARYLSVRFDPSAVSLPAVMLVIGCGASMAASVLHLIRREPHSATAAFWASLALFSFGAATLTMLGRGTAIPVPERYSPGGDGFWLAFVALALLTLARRPGRLVTVVNVGLLAAVGVFSVARDASMLIDRRDPDPASCDQCVLDYPLTRGDCFRRCFVWGDAQSVYHMAALRLSLFHDVTPALILPDALSPVIVDMPNRWLNVYVRDYMLSGIPRAAQIHVAPMQGTWDPPLPPPSPFFRGEWSTEVLSQPLTNTWEAVEQLTADFAKVINGVRHGGRWWYLNTPETEPHFSTIEAAFAAQGYRKQVARMTHRFSDARFTLWCFGVGERCADAASR